MKKQSGFTLIELVAVIVILAILAVVAVPQFVDLRVQAANSSAAGIGGAIASATSLNYARGVAGAGASTVTGCSTAQLEALLAGGAIPSGGGVTYTIGGPAGPIASAATATCTITPGGSVTGTAQNFTIIGCANGTCS